MVERPMVKLQLTATTATEADLLLGLLLRGAAAALRDDPALAGAICGALFGPTLLMTAEQVGASDDVVDGIHKATELEDLREVFGRDLVPTLEALDAVGSSAVSRSLGATEKARLLVSGGALTSTSRVRIEDS